MVFKHIFTAAVRQGAARMAPQLPRAVASPGPAIRLFTNTMMTQAPMFRPHAPLRAPILFNKSHEWIDVQGDGTVCTPSEGMAQGLGGRMCTAVVPLQLCNHCTSTLIIVSLS